MAFLFRGVHAHHPMIRFAREGTVRPANPEGLATPEEHNHDDAATESPYTSWTHARVVAEYHRDKTGPGGVLLRIPEGTPEPEERWHWEWSPDDYFEEEVLMHGIRMGVEVIQ